MKKIIHNLKNQLLLQYLLFGLVLFSVAKWQSHESGLENAIHLSKEHQQNLVEEFKHEYHRIPSQDELQGLLADEVKKEVLFREAVKHQIDQHDEIIRRRMISKMGFIMQNLATVEPPNDDTLTAYYHNHLENYRQPATYSLHHLYFSEEPPAKAMMDKISQGDLQFEQAKSSANQFIHGDAFKHKTLSELNQLFGVSFIKAIQINEQEILAFGPVASLYGHHIIWLDAVTPPTIAMFEDVRSQVYNDWFISAKEVAQKKAYDNLLNEYQVTIETLRNNGNDSRHAETPNNEVAVR